MAQQRYHNKEKKHKNATIKYDLDSWQRSWQKRGHPLLSSPKNDKSNLLLHALNTHQALCWVYKHSVAHSIDRSAHAIVKLWKLCKTEHKITVRIDFDKYKNIKEDVK